MIVKSEQYPSLLVVGVVQFVDGEAEVTDPALIERLRRFSAMGVVVPDGDESEDADEDSDADNDGGESDADEDEADDNDGDEESDEDSDDAPELVEPKGNASLDDWVGYAELRGIPAEDLDGLKREEIKQLLAG